MTRFSNSEISMLQSFQVFDKVRGFNFQSNHRTIYQSLECGNLGQAENLDPPCLIYVPKEAIIETSQYGNMLRIYDKIKSKDHDIGPPWGKRYCVP